MSNLITAGLAYDPYFYANSALEQLNKALGLAFYVHRDYEAEKGMEKGSTIQIRRPGTFSSQSMPIAEGSAEDVLPEYTSIVLDQWEGAMFALTDKELTYTRERMVEEHISPAAIAVADAIDQDLAALYADVPHRVVDDGTTPTNDFPNIRQEMFTNKAPDAARFYMVDGVLQNRYEKEAVFYQANTGVDGAQLQRDGFLGRKFGFDIFANQNSPTHTSAALTSSAPITDGPDVKGATSITIDEATLTGTLSKGDTFSIAAGQAGSGDYACTADATASGNSITVSISPPLRGAVADGVAITWDQTDATSIGLAAQRNAFALVLAPLSTMGNAMGARMATASDPITRLALRSRLWYTGGSAKVFVSLDALWGVKTLTADMAVRLEI